MIQVSEEGYEGGGEAGTLNPSCSCRAVQEVVGCSSCPPHLWVREVVERDVWLQPMLVTAVQDALVPAARRAADEPVLPQ